MEGLLASNGVVTIDQVEVVDVAMCPTLLAGCLWWFSCVPAETPDYLSLVGNGKRRFYPNEVHSKCSE